MVNAIFFYDRNNKPLQQSATDAFKTTSKNNNSKTSRRNS